MCGRGLTVPLGSECWDVRDRFHVGKPPSNSKEGSGGAENRLDSTRFDSTGSIPFSQGSKGSKPSSKGSKGSNPAGGKFESGQF